MSKLFLNTPMLSNKYNDRMEPDLEEGEYDCDYLRHVLSNKKNNDSLEEIDHINEDLLLIDFDDSISFSKMPLIDDIIIENLDEVYSENNFSIGDMQSSKPRHYFLLEFLTCFCIHFIVANNALMVGFHNANKTVEIGFNGTYLVYKIINIISIGFGLYIFTTPDTYKSINGTLQFLMINTIIYEYTFLDVLKYFAIQIAASIPAVWLAIGLYYHLIKEISTVSLVRNVIACSHAYTFDLSCIPLILLSHVVVSIGLSIICNDTTSLNANKKILYKMGFLLFMNLTVGPVIGSVGYVLSNFILYTTLIVIRNEYAIYDTYLLISYITIFIIVIILYPIVGVYNKFVWRRKYLKYIEY